MSAPNPYILAIESSCDDTSAAVLHGLNVLSNTVADQKVHQSYGGVVPELASREHQKHIVPVVHQALKLANITPEQVEVVAFTSGPGLMGSLLVGASFAKSFALARNLPLIEVHHMQAHVLAHFLDPDSHEVPKFPFLCLTVSGGHTQLVLVNSPTELKILGETQDDAAGEAFDKTAKMLGLPYPGGPEVDRLAGQGNPLAFNFSKPRVEGLNFSFSGLKTSILYFLEAEMKKDPAFISNNLADLCASAQRHIIEMLMDKLTLAAEQTGIAEIALAGGVSANRGLRKALQEEAGRRNWTVHLPPLAYCTDNAAMIGAVGFFRYLEGRKSTLDVKTKARFGMNAY